MNFVKKTLGPGLYLVATPIGTARDITLRALDTLASADDLVAEDTRTLRKLMELHGVPLAGRRVHAYHDHSAEGVRNRIVEAIKSGRSVAYASEAGTPLIADPGYGLVVAVRAAGLAVTAAPGPNAAIAALAIAGLPTDKFVFLGFPPHGAGARKALLSDYAAVTATLVFYESPRRLNAFLRAAAEVLGPEREAAICREITKRFEEVRRGTLGNLADATEGEAIKGECVVLIAKAQSVEMTPDDVDAEIRQLLGDLPVKEVAQRISEATGIARRTIYQRALKLQKDGS